MSNYQNLSVSDGTGDASLMHLTSNRAHGATVFSVDSVIGIPSYFIATVGTLSSTGFIDPTTKLDFFGHVSGATLVMDAWCPGSVDPAGGNTSGQVVVIKPNSEWSNLVAQFIKNATGNGTPENHTVANLTATGVSTATLATTGNTSVGGALTVTGDNTVSGISRTSIASVGSGATVTPNKQIYTVTALAVAATLNVPSFTATDGTVGVLRILDNGTSQALTLGTGWTNQSGLAFPAATTISKWLTIGYMYNAATTKWQILSISQEA
jgi:hypothetical protein